YVFYKYRITTGAISQLSHCKFPSFLFFTIPYHRPSPGLMCRLTHSDNPAFSGFWQRVLMSSRLYIYHRQERPVFQPFLLIETDFRRNCVPAVFFWIAFRHGCGPVLPLFSLAKNRRAWLPG